MLVAPKTACVPGTVFSGSENDKQADVKPVFSKKMTFLRTLWLLLPVIVPAQIAALDDSGGAGETGEGGEKTYYTGWNTAADVELVTIGRSRILARDIDETVGHIYMYYDVIVREAKSKGEWNKRMQEEFDKLKRRVRPDALRMLILMRLLEGAPEAKKLEKLQSDQESQDKRFRQILLLYGGVRKYETTHGPGSAERLRKYISDRITLDMFNTLLERFFTRRPDFASVKRYYDNHKMDFMRTERIRFRYIVIASSNYKSVSEARSVAQEMFLNFEEYLEDNIPEQAWNESDADYRRRASPHYAAAEKKFAELALKRSEDHETASRGGLYTSEDGGLVAYENITGLPDEFIKYLKRVPVHALTPQADSMTLTTAYEVKRPEGMLFFIPWITERRKGEIKPLEDVREKIENILRNKQLLEKKRDWFSRRMEIIPVRINGNLVSVEDLVPEG